VKSVVEPVVVETALPPDEMTEVYWLVVMAELEAGAAVPDLEPVADLEPEPVADLEPPEPPAVALEQYETL